MGGMLLKAKLSAETKEPLWTWKFMVLIVVNLANGVAGFMTVPLVASYAMHLGATLTTASTVSGILSLVSLFMCPLAGVLSDSYRGWIHSNAGPSCFRSQYSLFDGCAWVNRSLFFRCECAYSGICQQLHSSRENGRRIGVF